MNQSSSLIIVQECDIKDCNSIICYGEDIINEIRDISKSIASKIDSKSDNGDYLILSLNRIFDSIDYEELKSLSNVKQSGFEKVMNFITHKRDKIIMKYTGISGELDKMYIGVKQWELRLKTHNSVLQEAKSRTEDLKDKLCVYIESGIGLLSSIKVGENSSLVDKELYNLMYQKIQDLQYNLKVSEETIQVINMMLRSNYTIYRKLISIYTTSLPTIQNQVNMFNILKEYNEMTQTLSILDQKKRELMEFGATESVRIAKKSAELLNCNDDFDSLKKAIETLDTGMKDLLLIEETAMASINSKMKEYKMLGDAKSND